MDTLPNDVVNKILDFKNGNKKYWKQQFDIVLNTEVVEHVSDQKKLIEQCCECTKNKGIIIIATINKTVSSFFKAILGAEYMLRLLPRGTHNWNYFVIHSHIECTGNCDYCAHKSKLLKMSKDGILHTKSECEILEHNMNTQNCNSKGNTTYKILIRIPRPILNIYK